MFLARLIFLICSLFPLVATASPDARLCNILDKREYALISASGGNASSYSTTKYIAFRANMATLKTKYIINVVTYHGSDRTPTHVQFVRGEGLLTCEAGRDRISAATRFPEEIPFSRYHSEVRRAATKALLDIHTEYWNEMRQQCRRTDAKKVRYAFDFSKQISLDRTPLAERKSRTPRALASNADENAGGLMSVIASPRDEGGCFIIPVPLRTQFGFLGQQLPGVASDLASRRWKPIKSEIEIREIEEGQNIRAGIEFSWPQ